LGGCMHVLVRVRGCVGVSVKINMHDKQRRTRIALRRAWMMPSCCTACTVCAREARRET
jgi:hypothetical protein